MTEEKKPYTTFEWILGVTIMILFTFLAATAIKAIVLIWSF